MAKGKTTTTTGGDARADRLAALSALKPMWIDKVIGVKASIDDAPAAPAVIVTMGESREGAASAALALTPSQAASLAAGLAVVVGEILAGKAV